MSSTTSLEKRMVHFLKLSCDVLHPVLQAFHSGGNTCTKYLHLYSDWDGDDDMDGHKTGVSEELGNMLVANTGLVEVQLTNWDIHVSPLVLGLYHNSNITKFTVDGWDIHKDVDAPVALLQFLRCNHTMLNVEFVFNQNEPHSIIPLQLELWCCYLGQGLQDNSTLMEWNLRHVAWSKTGLVAILQSLRGNSTLSSLSIESLVLLYSTTLTEIGTCLPEIKNLKSLSLAFEKTSTSNISEQARHDFLQGVKQNFSLHHLVIKSAGLGVSDLFTIEFCMCRNTFYTLARDGSISHSLLAFFLVAALRNGSHGVVSDIRAVA